MSTARTKAYCGQVAWLYIKPGLAAASGLTTTYDPTSRW